MLPEPLFNWEAECARLTIPCAHGFVNCSKGGRLVFVVCHTKLEKKNFSSVGMLASLVREQIRYQGLSSSAAAATLSTRTKDLLTPRGGTGGHGLSRSREWRGQGSRPQQGADEAHRNPPTRTGKKKEEESHINHRQLQPDKSTRREKPGV